MKNLFKKKQTLKLLFLDFNATNIESITSAIKNLPIFIVHQDNRKDPFLLETGIEVTIVK